MHGAHDERMRAEEDAEHAEFIRQQKLAEKEEEVPDDEPSVENPEDEEEEVEDEPAPVKPETSVPVYRSSRHDEWVKRRVIDDCFTNLCGDCFNPKRQKIIDPTLVDYHKRAKCVKCGEVNPSCQLTQTCFQVCDFCAHHDADCPDGYNWSTDIPRCRLDDDNPEPSKKNYLAGTCRGCSTSYSRESEKLQLRCLLKDKPQGESAEEEEDEEEEESSDEPVEEPEPPPETGASHINPFFLN